jgi:hypothetical protein
MKDNILFRQKSTGKYITLNDDYQWSLSKKPNKEQAKIYIYDNINEIISDLGISFNDIEVIELNRK